VYSPVTGRWVVDVDTTCTAVPLRVDIDLAFEDVDGARALQAVVDGADGCVAAADASDPNFASVDCGAPILELDFFDDGDVHAAALVRYEANGCEDQGGRFATVVERERL